METRPLNPRIFISAALMMFLVIAAGLRASVPGTQNHNQTKLKISVSGKRSGQNTSIAGADILLRSQNGNFEANPTTDSQGVANISAVPFGKVLIQVTAAGWKTFGHNYDLNKKEQSITIELKPSQEPTPAPAPSPTSTPSPWTTR